MPTELGIDLNNPGLVLAVLGYFGFIFKDIPAQLWALVQQKYSVSIQVSSYNDYIYSITIGWLIETFPQLHRHVQYIGFSNVESDMADGLYTFMLDPFTYAVVSKEQTKGSYSQPIWNVACRIVGKNRYRYLEEYNRMVHTKMPDMKDHLRISYYNQRNAYTSFFYNHKKAFDDVFIPERMKKQIIAILDNFLASRRYYEEHGITYKIGIALSGPPGSGKTVVAKAIASYVGWKVRYVSAEDELDSSLTDHVIMFEDIDCIADSSREEDGRGSKRKDGRIPTFKELREAEERGELHTWENVRRISMHSLLNYVDGIMSPSSCIFIATTNYPERLDPALVRPGRFDYHFTIDHADRQLAERMCDRFGADYSVLDGFTFPCSLAEVQNQIMFTKISNRKGND